MTDRSKSGMRWLLLVHQLPPTPSNLRVRTWRRLQQLGAIAVKQAVYVLPDSPGAREDLEWLKTEIEGAGGEASVFAANSVDAWSDDALVEEFRRSRQQGYADLAGEVEELLARLTTPRKRQATRAPASRRLIDGFRQRLAALEAIDYFGSTGRDRVVTLLEQIEQRLTSGDHQRTAGRARTDSADVASYRGRVWVTRPRPGVDRMASAWLVTRFVDQQARFEFAADREAARANAIPFDMFGVDFSHHGEHCTFETLCERFGIRDPAIDRVAALVHDLDLKDGRFGAPEAATVGVLIDGLQLAHADDGVLLTHGMVMFDALYRSFERAITTRRAARPPKTQKAEPRSRRATARRRRDAGRAASGRTRGGSAT
jgi:hypothetical protein